MSFQEDRVTDVPEESLGRLAKLATEQLRLEAEQRSVEEELRQIAKRIQELSTQLIPAIMEEIGMESFTLNTGEHVGIKNIVKASIPTDKRDVAFRWLRDHGHGSLIKNEIVASFAKDEESVADMLEKDLLKRRLVYKRVSSVNSLTLGAFVREQLTEGNALPMDLLGVFQIKIAVVKK